MARNSLDHFDLYAQVEEDPRCDMDNLPDDLTEEMIAAAFEQFERDIDEMIAEYEAEQKKAV